MHGQETFEDYDSCGIFGEGKKSEEAPKTNRARIGDEYDCLWDCQWQKNPFFKSLDGYHTKLGTKDECFPMIHTNLVLESSNRIWKVTSAPHVE